MGYPKQQKYTLDEATQYIEYETGVPHPNLLELATDGKIGIGFYVKDDKYRFIRLNERNNKWESKPCKPLFGDGLKRIVIPIDKPNQNNLIGQTINPRNKESFPLLRKKDIQQFADNPDQQKINIMPWSIFASDSITNKIIKIAIVQYKGVGNSINEEYTAWQKEHGLPTFNFNGETRLAEGNFNYFETSTLMEISRSDLCIPAGALEYYINSFRAENLPLDEPCYSLKDAAQKIKELARKKLKKHNLINLAECGKIKLSIHKPDWKYVQIDKFGQEMEIMSCKVLGEGTIYLLVPRAGLFKNTKFNKEGLDAGTGTDESTLLCGDGHTFATNDGTIYPFLDPMHLRARNLSDDKKLKIYTHEMDATFQGKPIKVSKVNYETFPEKGNSNYLEFIEWLESNITWKSTNKDEDGLFDPQMHFESNYFYKLEGFKGRGVEITEKDLVITREELGNYLLTIMDAPKPVYQGLNQTVLEPETVEQISKSKKISPAEEKRRPFLIAWLDKQPPEFNPHDHDMTKIEVWGACGISEEYTNKIGRTFSEYNRDLITYKKKRPIKKQVSTPKPKDFNKNNPAIIPLRSST